MPRVKGRNVIAGLDVGTTKICCVIAEWSPVGNLEIIGVGTNPSRGLRKGVVVNIDSDFGRSLLAAKALANQTTLILRRLDAALPARLAAT